MLHPSWQDNHARIPDPVLRRGFNFKLAPEIRRFDNRSADLQIQFEPLHHFAQFITTFARESTRRENDFLATTETSKRFAHLPSQFDCTFAGQLRNVGMRRNPESQTAYSF